MGSGAACVWTEGDFAGANAGMFLTASQAASQWLHCEVPCIGSPGGENFLTVHKQPPRQLCRIAQGDAAKKGGAGDGPAALPVQGHKHTA